MNRSQRPAYWQLDMFILVMIGLMVAIMLAQLSAGWGMGVAIAWSTLAIAGMGGWVRANWAALQREEREEREARMRHRP